jgi:arylsulfatase A-like enzyme
MKRPLKMVLAPAAAAVLSLAAWTCQNSGNENLLRLTDLLAQKNVVQSPLSRLGESFVAVEQNVAAADLRKVLKDGQDYWAFATAAPMLQLPETDRPESASLRSGSEEWHYSETPLPSYPTWRVMPGVQPVDFRGVSASEAKKGPVVLSRGRALQASVLLPGGNVLFEFSAASGAPESYRPRLTVTVNGQARDILLGGSALIRFVQNVPLGETSLLVSFDSSVPASAKTSRPGHETAIIRAARVKCSSDLILVSLPQGHKSPSGSFNLAFVPEPADLFFPAATTIAPGEVHSQEADLPAVGLGTLSVSGRSLSGPGRLRLWRDAQELGSREVPDDGYFNLSFPIAVSKGGPAELKAAFEPAAGPAVSKSRAAGYFLDSMIWHNPRESLELPLIKLKNADLRDAGSGPNPWGIKKKLRVRGSTWNVLLAPAPSRFQFKIKVPPNAVLRIGYGLLREADEIEGNGARFEVAAESGGRRQVMFSDFRDPFHRGGDRDVFFKDIDLAAYGRKTILLSLATSGSAEPGIPGADAEDVRGDLCFWENPVIFPRGASAAPGRKNVILISLDAVRADHVGSYGYGRDTTPALDGMAKDGALFLNTISQAPYTLASHMTMLTGLYPTTHRVFHFSDSLDPSLATLADELRDSGLMTAGFTGGGLMDARYGYARGFDEYHDHIIAQEVPDTVGPLTRSVTRWLERNKDLNFFLFLHTYQAHSPYHSPTPYGEMFLDKDAGWKSRSIEQFIGAGYVHKYRPLSDAERRNVISLYDGDIRFLDEGLTRPLLEELKKRGLYEQTMIIITSDHGEEFFDHISWGHSNHLYNELLKVPLVIKYPGSRYRGRRLTPFVRLADIVPTVMDEFGVRTSAAKLDGASLRPILENKEKGERLCPSYLPDNIFADPMPSKISLIQGRYKFILNEKFPDRAYTYFSPPPPDVPPIELFDLRQDPFERRNLANQEGEVARRMLQQAQTFLQAAKREGLSKKALMDKELEERLRALGYIK